MVLDGHIREITGLSWNRDGYRLISSSGDASCKVWDVRMVRCTATIGAHKSLVSDVRYFNGYPSMSHPDIPSDRDDLLREEGTYFVTSGFDGTVNVSSNCCTPVRLVLILPQIYSSDDWAIIKTLSGHTGNVTSVDVSNDNKWIVSTGTDRTCKLWCQEDYGS